MGELWGDFDFAENCLRYDNIALYITCEGFSH